MSLLLRDTSEPSTALPMPIFDGIPFVMVQKIAACGSLESSQSLNAPTNAITTRNAPHYRIRSQVVEDSKIAITLTDPEQFVESASFDLPTLAHTSSLHLPSCFFSPDAVNLYEQPSTPSPLCLSSLDPTTATDAGVHTTNKAIPFEASFHVSCISQARQEVSRSLTPSSCLSACYPCTPCEAYSAERRQRAVKFLNFLSTFKDLKLTARKTLVKSKTLLKKSRHSTCAQSRAKAAEHRCSSRPNATLSAGLFDFLGTTTVATKLQKPNDYECIDSWIHLSNTSLDTTTASQSNKFQNFPGTSSSAVCSATSFGRSEEHRQPSLGRSSLLTSQPLFRSQSESQDDYYSYFLNNSDISSPHSVRMFTPARRSFCDANEGGEWSMPGGWPFNLLT